MSDALICPHCEEPILPGERREYIGSARGRLARHWECAARSVIGSVAHVECRCSCYVDGSQCLDPPGMTRRQAAQAALDALRTRNREWLNEQQ